MEKYDISICIPSRNEMFLSRTVQDILEHKKGKTEIIIGLDGAWANPGVPDHPDVKILYYPESIGQRAMTNQCVKLSKAKYIIKCDAHCSFDEGFDIKMLEAFKEAGDNVTMVMTMRNLHAFDWVCKKCGDRRYQGPTPTDCPKCDNKTDFERDIKWFAKPSPQSNSYCFDSEPHFQYFKEFSKRAVGQGELTESMSIQGSFFMLTREKYWELNISDEAFGSWGSQGIETACKTWLSGGCVLVNHKTWYAHLFRTQGGDFGFPYPQSGKKVQNAKKFAKDLFFENKWPKQKYPLSWLLEKFWPVQGWTISELQNIKKFDHVIKDYVKPKNDPIMPTAVKKGPTKGIIFYTDNQLKLKLAHAVQNQLRTIGLPIISTSLKPMVHFGKNIHVPLKRGVMTMFTQILTALKASDADIIFHCEHDVIYSPTHFEFTPPTKDKFYYNQNFWRIRLEDGFSAHWDANQVSGLCAYREHLIAYYEKRIKEVEEKGFNRSYEPGGRDAKLYETWMSPQPNIDIRHAGTLSGNKWSPDDFRDKSTCINWKEGYEIPGWGKTLDVIKKFKLQ